MNGVNHQDKNGFKSTFRGQTLALKTNMKRIMGEKMWFCWFFSV